MARLLLALLVLAAAAPAAAAADPPLATAETQLPPALWEGRAWQVELVGDLAVALEADLCHLVAVDLATGERRWRREVQAEANGYHTLVVVDGRLFLWAGPTLIELAPKTGRVLSRGEILHNRRECALMVDGPQGAASCDIGLWLFGLAPVELGPLLRATEIHLYEDLGRPHTTHYLQSARWLFGRADGLAVVAVEGDRGGRHGMFTAPAVLAAVDPTTGDARWRTSELVASGLTAGGITQDHGRAWVLSESTRAAGAVDAKTGALVWKVAAKGEDSPFNGDLLGDGSAMVVLADDVVTCRDLVTGAERWRAPAGGAQRVLVLGGRDSPRVYTGDEPMPVAVATPGGRVRVIEIPAGGQVFRDGDGLAIAWSGRVRRLDARGAVSGEVAGPRSGSWGYAPGAVSGFDDGAQVVYLRDGTRVAGLPAGTSVGGGRGDAVVLMTRASARDEAGTARLVRAAPARTPRPPRTPRTGR
ncbi:MAG: hypothetical protein CVU56_26640 [Deltaproteobacteria bacterium HGW-Deltaproteobacteria-14]|jgi:outer membrane protein assembly factor BamB|nr:MAG: hypothetical protein CVU56_26640 [Deltaproteobacteria bacterium HGW-Deltaproteobacteria-14]